jgi:hypothetical protein
MNKRVLTLSAVLVLSLAACGAEPELESAAPPTPSPSPSASPSSNPSPTPTGTVDAEEAGDAYRKQACLDMINGVTNTIPQLYEKYRCKDFDDRPPRIAEDGIWKIGDDFPAGTYRVTESVSGMDCYWTKSSDPEGEDIISNDVPSGGRPQVSLKNGQWFTTERCGVWEKVS